MGRKKGSKNRPKEVLTPELSDEEKEFFDSRSPKGGERIEVIRIESESDGEDWDYYWMLYAANGVQVATGVHPQHRLNDLKETVESVAATLAEAPYVRLY